MRIMNAQAILAVIKLIDIVVLGISIAPKQKAAYDKYKAEIEEMVKEGRDPSEAQWQKLLETLNKNTEELES